MSGTLNYVDYSIQGLTTQLNNLLLESNTWQDVLTSSTGEIAINWWVCIANLILYYVERTAEEMYISTAQKESSVLNLVQLLGYVPYRNVSAQGNMTLTLPGIHSSSVFIPAQTGIESIAGYFYQVAQDSVILQGQTTVVVPVIQGQWLTNTYASNGNANQTYLINNTEVENSNLIVTVNNAVWTPVSTFIGATPSSTVYNLISNINGTLTIQFGNGIFGLIPETGQSIVINFLQSDGVNGNIYGSGVDLSLISNVYDALGVQVTGITVTNTAPIIGGANAETVDQIKINGPQVFATGQRAITKADFRAIIGNYPGVTTSNVWGENDLNPPNYNAFNTIYISTVLQNWQAPTTQFNLNLGNFLYNYSSLTVKYSFIAPQIIQVMPYISMYVLQGASLSAVQSAVNTAFSNSFLLGTTAQLGVNVRYADVITAVNSVPGIDYVYLTLAVYLPLTASFTSAYNFGQIAPLLNIKPGTAKVYSNAGILLGVDNGFGGWTTIASGDTLTGNINYTTGVINLNVSPTQASAPYVVYQQDENGDLVVGKNQILEYHSMITQVLQYG